MARILLFDFDGTIADSFENFLEILQKLSVKYNLPILTREEYEKLRSDDARTLIKYFKIPFYKIPLLARDMKKYQHEQIANLQPFEGLVEVLRELKTNGIRLGILTSNGKANVELFLKKHGIDSFDYIYSDSSMFGKDKVIKKFLKEQKAAKEDILYVGDEIRDIQACQKIGVRIAAVSWGFNTKESLMNNHPDFVIDKPAELLQIVSR